MLLLAALFAVLLQVLSAPDPAQMEHVPELGYVPVPSVINLPAGMSLGAPASVAVLSSGNLLVFNRGAHPLVELDRNGTLVRSFGEGLYDRPHGLRLDREGNIWTTDVNAHTVMKLSPDGRVLLTLGVKGQAGDWNEAAQSKLFNEPNDVAIGPSGEIFVVQGHGKGDPRVLKFDSKGTLIKTWGGKGTGSGQFDWAHAIVIDRQGMLYVADRMNRRIQLFDLNGTFVKEWKYAGTPGGLDFDAAGQLYMSTSFAGQIVKLDANGRAVAATGQPGKKLGEFGEAHYLAVRPGGETIYVADTINAVLHTFVRK